jgi:curved DNA-binding protein CbpA
MLLPTFRGDPYRVLGVESDATDASIKRRWRDLARAHHPDRASDPAEAEQLTRRMARINAAYDLLRDSERRARYDARAPAGFRGSRADGDGGSGQPFSTPAGEAGGATGPSLERPSRPVTARFDASAFYQARNATRTRTGGGSTGQRPAGARERRLEQEPLRASDPTGPVRRRHSGRRARIPTLEEARVAVLEFGKFRGHTLGEVELFEPTYIDWVARTITRDGDVVMRARVIQADMDARGLVRRYREPGRPPFGQPRSTPGSDEAG